MKNSMLNDRFFSRLETFSLNLKSNLTGYFGGKNLVSTYGQTVEFADYREYQLGDDIRRIDWNLFSRFEKYFLKLFTDERQMQVQIFLDISGSMGKDNPKKADYAISTAAALGFLAVQNMDRVSLNIMDGDKCENPFGTIVGKNSFYRAVSQFDKIQFKEECNIDRCIMSCPTTGTKNGLTVIISDFFSDDWKKAVDYLCYKKRQVLLIQIMTPEELDPTFDGRYNLIDSEADNIDSDKNMKIRITRSMLLTYHEALHDFQSDIKMFCRKRDVGFMALRTDVPIEKALFSDLMKVGIMS